MLSDKDLTSYGVCATAEKEYVSHEVIVDFAIKAAAAIRAAGLEPLGVYGIPRGGLVPAVYLSHVTGWPLLSAPQTGCIIVDDIADSGATLEPFIQAGFFTVAVYKYQECRIVPDFYLKLKTNKWIEFFWEQQPIAVNIAAATTGRLSCEQPNEAAKPQSIRLRFNPLEVVLQACSNLYGNKLDGIEIALMDLPLRGKNRTAGFTQFPDDPAESVVLAINCKLPFMHVPEIIAHEIAHFVVGVVPEAEEHGSLWEAEFTRVQVEYNRLAAELSQFIQEEESCV